MHGDKQRRRGPTSEGHAESGSAGFSHILNSCTLLGIFNIFFVTVSVCVCHSKVFSSMQESLGKLMVNKRWYGDRDDFTVIMQDSPFLSDMSIISVSQTLTVIVCLHHLLMFIDSEI